MDNRRLALAVIVSFGLLFGWQAFSSFMGWSTRRAAPTQPETARPAPAQADAPADAPVPPISEAGLSASPGRQITVDTPLYTAVFDSAGAVLQSFTLKHYQSTDPDSSRPSGKALRLLKPEERAGTLGLLLGKKASWRVDEGEGARWGYEGAQEFKLEQGRLELEFKGIMDGVQMRRVFSFAADSYVLSEKLTLAAAAPLRVELAQRFATGNLAGPEEYNAITKIALLREGAYLDESDLKDLALGISYGDKISWAGIMGTYFLAAAIPSDPDLSLRAGYEGGLFHLLLERGPLDLGPGQSFSADFHYYFGPKRQQDMLAAPADFSEAMEYGWFGWIAAPLLAMLKWFYSYTGNWGASIILLTVLVKIVLWPLSYKSYKSMDNMKKLQPLILKIREKYKHDKTLQNQEVMRLYKTYKVNPMGGCLPILVQLPVFFGLYRALLSSIELRQAAFIEFLPFSNGSMVWLADLSLKDPLYITPIIMGLTMLLQQRMTPNTGDPTQAKIMMFMPVLFTFLFLSFPSGLVLYWLFNNIISIAQQYGQMKYSAARSAREENVPGKRL